MYLSICYIFGFIITSKCCFFQGLGYGCDCCSPFSTSCETSSYQTNYISPQTQDFNCSHLPIESPSTQSINDYIENLPKYLYPPKIEDYTHFNSTINKIYPIPQARIF